MNGANNVRGKFSNRIMRKRVRLEHYLFLGLCGFLLAIALTLDYHRAIGYMFGDEAVYYMMAQSLAYDQDLEYTRQDLQRVYEDGWHAGPQGVFLSKTADGDISYAKSWAYALFAAPFLLIFGFKGFLVLNILLLLLMIWLGWVYLRQFNPPLLAFLVAATFFLLSASFVYTFWSTPETFNMACITLGLFLWLYQRDRRPSTTPSESAASSATRAGRGWLSWLVTTPQGRLYLAPIPIAIACASKLPNALFILPIVADMLLDGVGLLRPRPSASRGQNGRSAPAIWRWGAALLIVCLLFWAVVGVFYGLQYVFTGHLNPYAGDRRTFYWQYPFSTVQDIWEKGITLSNDVYFEESFYFNPRTVLYNLYYYVVGRFTGLLPYFCCSLLALYYFVRQCTLKTPRSERKRPDLSKGAALSLSKGRTTLRRIALLLTIVASILAYIIVAPSNYHGGGGAFGNRFFVNIYPAFLFLITGISSRLPLVISWIVGSLFLAQSLINPFQTSAYPASHAFRWPYRWLPVELTLINTLPTLVNSHLMQTTPPQEDVPHRLYFFDENILDMGPYEFVVQGERTAELALRPFAPCSHLVVTITNGAVTNQVDVTVAGQTQSVVLDMAREQQRLLFPLRNAVPFFNTSLFPIKIRSHTGFVPKFVAGTGLNDPRYIGCRVRLSLDPGDIVRSLLDRQQPQQAIELLEPELDAHPESIQLHYYLALAYSQTSQPEAALRELEVCRSLLPRFQDRFLVQVREQPEQQAKPQTMATLQTQQQSPQQKASASLSDLLGPMTHKYEAEDLSWNTGDVMDEAAASQGQSVYFDPTRDTPGFLVYGQDQKMLPAEYQVKFRMRLDAPDTPTSFSHAVGLYVDIYNSRYGILARRPILIQPHETALGRGYYDYTLNFEIPIAARLEFRAETTGHAEVAIDTIEVYPRFPLRLYQTLARAHSETDAPNNARFYWQQVLGVNPTASDFRCDVLHMLLTSNQWDELTALLQQERHLSAHTGGATCVLEADPPPDAPPALRQVVEDLDARFTPHNQTIHHFDAQIAFLGYDLPVKTVTAGKPFTIRYYWQALQTMDADYAFFVHFMKKDALFVSETLAKVKRKLLGVRVTDMFQNDHFPLNGAYPTRQWLAGERIREHFTVTTPTDIEPGVYEIWLGVWNPLTKTRLSTDGTTKVKIGEIQIDE
jgi:tetratricopeptide (TPR) repeat protein